MQGNNKPSVNTITLTKEAYDKIKSENMRCRMLLDGIFKTMRFASDDSNDIVADFAKLMILVETVYPDTYAEKARQLKRLRTIEREKALGRE